jgi:hypothetical protein
VNDAPAASTAPSQPARKERRRNRRIPLQAIVHYKIDGHEFIHISSDLSCDGIFIKNFSPPAVGTELALQVRLPEDLGGHQLELLGRVVRVAESEPEAERGMGVAFTSVQACSAEAIRFFVNEVYDVDVLARLEQTAAAAGCPEPDEPAYRYTPDPDEVFSLLAGDRSRAGGADRAQVFADPRQRWIWGGALVLIGAALGAGLLAVFWLGV